MMLNLSASHRPGFSSIRQLVFAVFLCASVLSVSAQNEGVDLTFNANPGVNADLLEGVARYQPDGKVLVVVQYTNSLGEPASAIYRANTDGTIDDTFNCTACGFRFSSLAIQSDGKIILAGNSTPISAPKMVRLNPDGSLDGSFATGQLPGTHFAKVWAVAPDGKVYAATYSFGFHIQIESLFRFNADGSRDNSFAQITFDQWNFNHVIAQLQPLADGGLMIAGRYTWGPIFKVNSDGSRNTDFFAPVITCAMCPAQIPASVHSFFIQADDEVAIAGNFTSVNGVARAFFARLNTDGSVDDQWIPNPTIINGAELGGKKMMVQSDGKIMVSGPFRDPAFNPVEFIRLNANGSVDNTFNLTTAVNGLSSSVLDSSDRVLFFGDLQSNPKGFYRLTTAGAHDTSFNLSLRAPGAVTTMALQPDGKVLVSGGFIYMNGTSRNNIARVNTDGTLDTAFVSGTGFTSPADQLLVQPDGRVLARGSFTGYNGQSRPNLARLNPDGGLDTSFTPDIANVNTIALLSDGKILLGGGNITVNGNARPGLARLNADGSFDPSFSISTVSPNITSVAVQPDGKIMIGGTFSGVGGLPRSNLARLNSDGSTDASFNASISNVSRLIVQPDGKYLGVTNNNVVFRRNNDGSVDSGFQTVTVSQGAINALLLESTGSFIIGGTFTTPRAGIARFASNGVINGTFLPSGANARVTSLVRQGDGKVIAGGDFTRIGNVPRPGIARLSMTTFLPPTAFDFDGDGRADIGVLRPSTSDWYILPSTGGTSIQNFGASGDISTPADYDGDGKTDLAIFRPSTGTFWYKSSVNGGFYAAAWGQAGDIPRPGDFDGDGRADFIVFRPSTSSWYRMSATGAQSNINFGLPTDLPVTGDFDGDRKVDPAVYRPSTGTWWYRSSINGAQVALQWGLATDIPTPADFDGDGRTDVAVFRPSSGAWYIVNSSNFSVTLLQFGLNGDRPVAADYDGDGKADIAVYRPSVGVWYILQSTAGFTGGQWGVATDVAIPNSFVPQ